MSSSSTYTRTAKVLSAHALTVLRGFDENLTITGGFRLISNGSYLSDSSMSSEESVMIPDELNSQATIQFLEFTEEVSIIIFESYETDLRNDPDRAHIMHSVRSHIRSIEGNATGADDSQWTQLFDRIGLTKRYQHRVMDPAMKDMRLMGSLKELVLESTDMRYGFLKNLDKFITTMGQGNPRKVYKMSEGGKFIPGKEPKIPQRTSSLIQGGSSNKGTPTVTTTQQDPPTELASQKIFYKGSALHRLEAIFMKSGEVNFSNIVSTPPGDFSRITGGLYFTKNAQVAYRYAEWARRVVDGNVVPVGILTVAIPDELMASVGEVFGESWRKFVWVNRRGTELMPQELEYLQEYQWLVGPICHRSNDIVSEMNDEAELEVWRINGEAVQQIWTGSVAMINILTGQCKGKVWVRGLQAET